MDELGQILREARQARGLTLEQAAEETRINQRFLDALEQGDYAVLPSPVHVRGFLRNYARFLKLDPAPLLERYKRFAQQRPPQPQPPPAEETPLPAEPLAVQGDQPFFDPVNFEIESGQTRDSESALRLVIIVALVIFLGLVASRFIPLLTGNGDGSQAIEAGISDVWRQVIGQETPQPAAAGEGEGTAVSSELALTPGGDAAATEVIQNTSRNDFSEAPAGADAGAAATITPTRPPLPATMEEIQIRLDVTERTWMEATIDGDVRFSGIARRGDTFEWTAEEEVRLLTGNAHGIVAVINEVDLGRLGGFQEAKEEIWTTTQ